MFKLLREHPFCRLRVLSYLTLLLQHFALGLYARILCKNVESVGPCALFCYVEASSWWVMEEFNKRAAVNIHTLTSSVEATSLFFWLLSYKLLYLGRVVPVDTRLDAAERWLERSRFSLCGDQLLHLFWITMRQCYLLCAARFFILLLLRLDHSESLRLHLLVLLTRYHVQCLITWVVFRTLSLRWNNSLLLR